MFISAVFCNVSGSTWKRRYYENGVDLGQCNVPIDSTITSEVDKDIVLSAECAIDDE